MKTAISRTKTKKNGKAKSKTPATDRLLTKGYELYSVSPKKIERVLPDGARERLPVPGR
jgi:hypothetical protein